jgi:2-keto-3-deoxy-galactonokinase
MSDPIHAPGSIASTLAGMPDVIARILANHVPDDRGRCRACGMPGTGTPYVRWPCSLASVAEVARRIHSTRN